MADYSKLDHWSLKAQKEAYPARSVYKLKEMDEKFGLLKTGRSAFNVLDLGSAPGSWDLYVLRKFAASKNGVSPLSLVSVDLAPLSRTCDQGLFSGPGFFFIQGDFTKADVRENIISRGPYNLLLSDAAPATSGNRSLDTLRSLALAEAALDYAVNTLKPGANMVVKVFQGGDTADLLKAMRGLFETGKGFKPEASRSESFETYYLGMNYL